MPTLSNPAAYDAWYDSPRGRWISDTEFDLLWELMQPHEGEYLLDVGCGTGHFSRRFSQAGLLVIGIDSDLAAVNFSHHKEAGDSCLVGNALMLPFADQTFDHVTAITSLCFIGQPEQALSEMWRVSRRTVTLGLLNRHSLLHRTKSGQGGYSNARWDTISEVRRDWLPLLSPTPAEARFGSAILFPQGNRLAKWADKWLSHWLPWGGFLGITLKK
jgi:ubiquinone/menaquinone biosynthesis C-methylase UbiE